MRFDVFTTLVAIGAVVLVLGLQTDVIGVPWIAVTVWALAADTET